MRFLRKLQLRRRSRVSQKPKVTNIPVANRARTGVLLYNSDPADLCGASRWPLASPFFESCQLTTRGAFRSAKATERFERQKSQVSWLRSSRASIPQALLRRRTLPLICSLGCSPVAAWAIRVPGFIGNFLECLFGFQLGFGKIIDGWLFLKVLVFEATDRSAPRGRTDRIRRYVLMLNSRRLCSEFGASSVGFWFDFDQRDIILRCNEEELEKADCL